MGNVIFFFFLQTSSWSSTYGFPSIPCPQDSVSPPPRTLSFPLPRPFFVLGSIGVLHQKLGVLNHWPSVPPVVSAPSAPSEHERLSHPVTERSVVQVMEEVAPLLGLLPSTSPKSSVRKWHLPLGNRSCFLTSFPPPGALQANARTVRCQLRSYPCGSEI